MRIAHLTDPHLTSLRGVSPRALLGKRAFGFFSWWRKRRHEHRPETLAALTGHLADAAPDLIFVTGDLVHVGLPEELRVARGWLEELATIARVVLVPGNHDCYRPDSQVYVHDVWADFLHTRPNDRSGFPSVVEVDDVTVIGLSSAVAMPVWSAQGSVGAAQLGRLERVLDESTGRFRCVGLHHPPLSAAVPRRKALTDAAALAALLARHGVGIVLHGHVHRNTEAVIAEGTRVYATASCSRATGPDRASFRLFDIQAQPDAWRVTARLHTLDADGGVSEDTVAAWSATRTAAPRDAGEPIRPAV